MDVLSPESRRKAMQSVKSSDTKPEILLRKTLWHKGLRYRKNWRALPGTPDIALTRQKIAVFVDGDFWHARGHEENPGEQIASRQEYWRKKLSRNVERDKEVADALTQLGWLVLRFWESDTRPTSRPVRTSFCNIADGSCAVQCRLHVRKADF